MSFLKNIPRQVTVLGFVSFFTDLASEMLYPIIPLFLTGTLGVSTQTLGLLEGIAEAISTSLRWIGGVLSDLAQKRKPFVLAGYTTSALSKPIMGLAVLATALWAKVAIFLVGRATDRLGKSIRTAARDALIADATPPEHRGLAFGWHRAMDTCGAILGPLVALVILVQFSRAGSPFPLEYLFYLALLPGLASSALVYFAVKDSPHPPAPDAARAKARFLQSYPRPFIILLLANILFSLGNSSDSLLILRSTQLHFGSAKTPLVTQAIFATALFATFNGVYALFATPAGKLSDMLSRKTVITVGWLIYAAVYAGFALADHAGHHAVWLPWLLFASYGLYQAFSEGVTKAYITDLVPAHQRAGAIGLYYTASGLAQFAASALVGILWQHVGPTPAFLTGTLFPLLALPLLLSVPRPSAIPPAH